MTPEQRAARLHYHMYDSLEGIEQQSERIVALEELVEDMWEHISKADRLMWPELSGRMSELGVEVPE